MRLSSVSLCACLLAAAPLLGLAADPPPSRPVKKGAANTQPSSQSTSATQPPISTRVRSSAIQQSSHTEPSVDRDAATDAVPFRPQQLTVQPNATATSKPTGTSDPTAGSAASIRRRIQDGPITRTGFSQVQPEDVTPQLPQLGQNQAAPQTPTQPMPIQVPMQQPAAPQFGTNAGGQATVIQTEPVDADASGWTGMTPIADYFASGDGDDCNWYCNPNKKVIRLHTEHMQWWTSGMQLPTLVTSSPVGTPVNQAGVLGAPGTALQYGGNDIFEDGRAGGRYVASIWWDECSPTGLELEYFGIFSDDEGFSATSTNGILARPFTNAISGLEDSKLVAYPGLLSGTIGIDSSTVLNSASFRLRYDLRRCNCEPETELSERWVARWSATAGYRFMELDEDLSIREDLTDPITPATIRLRDRFETENQLHAAEFGILGEIERMRWNLDLDFKVAVGANRQKAKIQGSTDTVAAGIPAVHPGGLLAQVTNNGSYEQDKFAVVPQFGVQIGYRVIERLKIFAGYRFFYWPDVVRPGDQIDLVVNPNLIAPAVLPAAGPARPRFDLREQSFFAQALSLGLEFTW